MTRNPDPTGTPADTPAAADTAATTPAATIAPLTPGDWVRLGLLSLVWGGSFFFVGVAVHDLPPLTITALRVALAALALYGVILITGMAPLPPRSAWREFLPLALISNVIPFSLIVWSQTHIDSGLAAILNATMPLSTVLVAHMLTDDEKITRLKLLGLGFGLTGVIAIIGPSALSSLGGSGGKDSWIELLAQLAILGATISYGFATVRGRRMKSLGIEPLTAATGMLTMAAVVLVPLALLIDRPWTLPPPGWETPAAILGLALLSTAAAYLLYFRILGGAGATNLALVTFLIPITATTLGVLFLNEEPSWRQGVGILAIGAGLACIDGRLPRRLRKWLRGDPV